MSPIGVGVESVKAQLIRCFWTVVVSPRLYTQGGFCKSYKQSFKLVKMSFPFISLMWHQYPLLTNDLNISNLQYVFVQVHQPSQGPSPYFQSPQAHVRSLMAPVQLSNQPQPQQRIIPPHQKARGKRILEKRLESSKKNSESNIANQLFSYFSHMDKSEKLVLRAIALLGRPVEAEKIKSLFYNIVRLASFKRGRSYVNKDTIKSYYTPDLFQKLIPDIREKLEEIGLLTLQELCFLFRVCTHTFINTISVQAILTSKRVAMVAKGEHLKRRRIVLAYIQENQQ